MNRLLGVSNQCKLVSPNLDTDSFFDSFLAGAPSTADSTTSTIAKQPSPKTSSILPPSTSRLRPDESHKSSENRTSARKNSTTTQPSGAVLSPPDGGSSSGSSNKHHRSKSSGNVSPVHSQKSNGLSSASESIEVLSLISSEKLGLGESYYQDFSSPPKLNVLHKVLDSARASSSSSSANNQHSPNSSDYGVEEASCSPPDETEEITLHAPVDTTSAVASEPLPHPPTDIVLREEEHHGAIDEDNSIQSSNTIPQVQISNVTVSPEPSTVSMESSQTSVNVQSWLMISETSSTTQSSHSPQRTNSPTNNTNTNQQPLLTTAPSVFQPDLLPVTDEFTPTLEPISTSVSSHLSANSEYSSSSTVELRAVTPPDIQQMTALNYNPASNSESLHVLPDVQLNTSLHHIEEGFPEPQIPDLTNSSRERPDIFPSDDASELSRPNQNVDLVVQELDVIRAVDENTHRLSELQAEDSVPGNEEFQALRDVHQDIQPNAIDVVVQELDVVQSMEQSSSNAVTSLDILPTNLDRESASQEEPNIIRTEHESVPIEEREDQGAMEPMPVDLTSQQMSILNDLPTTTMDRTGANVASMYSEMTESQVRNGERTAIIDELLEKIQNLEETIQAREQQLFAVNKRATDAQEENEELKSQLEIQFGRMDEEVGRLSEAHQLELNTVTIKYNSSQQRLRELEKQMNDLKSASSLSSQLQFSLAEKDAVIEEMRREGEKLAQEEYKKNSVIKKLKAKEKELQTSLDKTKQSLDEKTEELESYTDSFTKLQQKVAEQRDTINQMNSTMTKNELQLVRKNNETEELTEKTNALQNNLDSVFRELRECQQQLADKEAKFAQSQAVVNEEILQEKEEALKAAEVRWAEEKELMTQQLQDAGTSAARMEQAATRRENLLKDEIKDLQMRLEEEMQRGQGLSEGVSQATQPLWNQISRLQRQQQDQQSQWTQLEKNYLDRLAEAEMRAGQAAESERLANESSVELKMKLSTLEAQLSTVRSEHTKALKVKEQKEADLARLTEQVTKLKEELVTASEKMSVSERQMSILQADLEAERQTVEQVKRKCRTLEDNNREMTLRLKESESGGYPSKFSASQQQPPSQLSPGSVDGLNGKSGGNGAPINSRNLSSWEFLESQVKLKDGEASALQTELRKLEQQNITLREDFVRLSNERHDWQNDKETLTQLKEDLTELQQRYETLLTMYGEKAEEVDELRMDLSDVKVIYKAQIEDLVKKLTQQKI
ncbi:TATA element modulatory factor-like isoform X2 [Convolutriloba macropyga]|uniref:TATA element modulatory factor-like isoform X2 n=1 Tax=Convolutriloba macropyga TaxID=536237 RepID=UPI003F51ACFB